MEEKMIKDIETGSMFKFMKSSPPLILVKDINNVLYGVNLIDNVVSKLDPDRTVYVYTDTTNINVANPDYNPPGLPRGHCSLSQKEDENYRKIGIVWEKDIFVDMLRRTRM